MYCETNLLCISFLKKLHSFVMSETVKYLTLLCTCCLFWTAPSKSDCAIIYVLMVMNNELERMLECLLPDLSNSGMCLGDWEEP